MTMCATMRKDQFVKMMKKALTTDGLEMSLNNFYNWEDFFERERDVLDVIYREVGDVGFLKAVQDGPSRYPEKFRARVNFLERYGFKERSV